MNIRKLCLVVLAFSLLLVGCSYETGMIDEEYIIRLMENQENGLTESIYKKSESSGISVPLPQSQTSIYINRLGYSVNDDKKALFSNKEEGDIFNVVNADTKTVVYSDKITGDNIKTGDFSQVTQPGNYYIETDYVGRSYDFTISDNIYSELFTNAINSYYGQDENLGMDTESVIDACFGMDIVILTMQCNGDVFDGESNIVEQLLRMSGELIAMQEDDGSVLEDYRSTAAFCGIVGMCAGEFGKYEDTIDAAYKEAALKAWQWLEANNCDTDERTAARFYAAAQLYNLLKTTEYREISEKYLTDRGSEYSADPFTFFGAVSYMDSKAEVDMNLCTYVMMDMITQADNICDSVSVDKIYRVGVSDIDDVMTDTVQICFFNYLVPSSEYISVLSSAIEYIGGYNPEGINYMEEDLAGKTYEYKGVMIFAICNVLAAYNN